MFSFDNLMSEDYMMGFLIGKALCSQKSPKRICTNSPETSEEDIRIVDSILTQEMDQEIIKRLREKDSQDSL